MWSYIYAAISFLLISIFLLILSKFLHQSPTKSMISTIPSPWPETPFKLIAETGARSRPDIPKDHYCIRTAHLMALTHNTISRGFNAIYAQAVQVLPGTQDAADLLAYCTVVHGFLQNHHETEESTYFPQIEKAAGIPGLMQGNVEQHHAFEEQLERFRKYAAETSKEKYSGEALRGIIDAMAGPLGQHLHEEIPTILDLWDKIDSKTTKKIYREMHDLAERTSDGFK
jgi:hemerythrin-like domain-containing protein